MILLNKFYTVTKQTNEENSLHATICIHPEDEIFKGHFPDQPVVPGVCMIQVIKELLEQFTGKKILFSKGSQIKFLQLLTPDNATSIQVSINWEKEEMKYITNADFKRNNEAVFKLSGVFTVV